MRNLFNKKYNINNNILIFIFISIILFVLDLNKSFFYLKNNLINKKIHIFNKYLYIINNNIKNINIKNLNNFYNLSLENKKLKKKLSIQKFKNILLNQYKKENDNFKKILNINNCKTKIISAKIMYLDYENSILIINKGLNNNIKLGQPVLNEYGILGQIVNLENEFSYVLLTSSRKSYIPVKILRNDLAFILKGYGYKNELYFYNNIDTINNESIKNDDILISSGIDNKYPEGYPVGIIKNLKINNNRINNISIKCIFNNKHINYVFIIEK